MHELDMCRIGESLSDERDLFPISVLGTDGKVIISTLPSGKAPGADLFGDLHPLERVRFASDLEDLQWRRLFFRAKDGGFILHGGMCCSHGVILAVRALDVDSRAFVRAARDFGYEELRTVSGWCYNQKASSAASNAASAAEPILFMRELEGLFEDAQRASFLSERETERSLNGFTQLARVRAQVSYQISDTALLRDIDGRMIGAVALIASSLSNAAGGDGYIYITFRERAKRLWLEIEIPAAVKSKRPCAARKLELDKLSAMCSHMWGLKCKNFRAEDLGTSVKICYSPTVFDPTAEGLMQDARLKRRSWEGG